MTIDLKYDVDTFRWLPPDPPNYVENSCSQQYQEFQQRVREHEAGHVADDTALLAKFRAEESVPKVRVCGVDANAAREDIKGRLAISSEEVAKRIKTASEDAGKTYDNAHHIEPMDCSSCP